MCGCADYQVPNFLNYYLDYWLTVQIRTYAHTQIRTFSSWLLNCKGLPMNWTQAIGLGAGILTASSLIPQVIKTLKTKKADEVSIKMLLVLQAGIILWIVYGFKRDDLPLIVTNIFSLLVNITMVVLRVKYGHKRK
jgi:MtN3 and saliva related transmembrane protein